MYATRDSFSAWLSVLPVAGAGICHPTGGAVCTIFWNSQLSPGTSGFTRGQIRYSVDVTFTVALFVWALKTWKPELQDKE